MMTKEDKAWFRAADEDSIKALAATEEGISKEEMEEYLSAIRRNSKPVKWNARLKAFVVQGPKEKRP